MSDAADEIIFGRDGGLATVLLNRPKALNALTHEMAVALDGELRGWAGDNSVHAVLVEGAGDRAFCAGGDIVKLYNEGRAGGQYPYDFYHDEYRTNALIHYYSKPYISFLNGIVMGGGCGVSIPGSHRVATENVMFAMPETGIGLFPDVGGSFFLSRCPGHVGEYLALTGSRLKAADCLYAGVADVHVPAARLAELKAALAAAEVSDFNHATRVIEGFAADPGEAPLATVRDDIDRHFSLGSAEEILASLDSGGGEWAAKTASIIRSKSPTSTKVALRQVRDGASRDFRGCMQMEWRMVNRIIAGHDFYEGTRATVIDKDQKPAWQPGALEEVSDADVEAYFAPLNGGDLTFD